MCSLVIFPLISVRGVVSFIDTAEGFMNLTGETPPAVVLENEKNIFYIVF